MLLCVVVDCLLWVSLLLLFVCGLIVVCLLLEFVLLFGVAVGGSLLWFAVC